MSQNEQDRKEQPKDNAKSNNVELLKDYVKIDPLKQLEVKVESDDSDDVDVVEDVERIEGDSRDHVNVVFVGNVDAGKSTTCGRIIYDSGLVDERQMERFIAIAREKGMDSWLYAFILDTTEEERKKGKTIEVGRIHFSTEKKRITLLDAPGHDKYIPNMINGACQADIGVIVISARRGEFEAGFMKDDGRTKEHAVLCKTLGIKQIIVAINKMDDSTVNWSEERYNEITSQLSPFLKKLNFNPI